MGTHLHLIVISESRECLTDGARYLFGQLARRLNTLWRRRGRVFDDRYASQAGRSVRHAFQTIGYVLRNPRSAGLAPPDGPLDPYVGADESLLGRSYLSPTGESRCRRTASSAKSRATACSRPGP